MDIELDMVASDGDEVDKRESTISLEKNVLKRRPIK